MPFHVITFVLALVLLPGTLFAQPRDFDGVPLPSTDVSSQLTDDNSFAGAWSGLWGNRLKHILVVQNVQPDGTADVIYAYGDQISWGLTKGWSRYPAKIQDDKLTVNGAGFAATYKKLPSGVLIGTFQSGRSLAQAVLSPLDLQERKPKWSSAKSEYIDTELFEDGKPIKLEVVTFKPKGAGPFPLAIVNHGSTGDGKNPAIAQLTFAYPGIAQFLTDRGYMVAFPQRRGRGKSDGLYDEGFRDNRSEGYSCSTDRSLAGAERAITDLEQVVKSLHSRSDVKPGPVLLSGISRGGILAMAYAGRHPTQVSGVINFVGGWMGERCANAEAINDALFSEAAKFPTATLSLYGKGDPFYSIKHTQSRFRHFIESGGKGTFQIYDVPGGNGHALGSAYHLWAPAADDYLSTLTSD